MFAGVVLAAGVVMAATTAVPASAPVEASASHVHVEQSDRIELLVRVMCTRDEKGLYLDAAERLARMEAESVPALERCLDSEDWFTRQVAAYALRLSKGYVPTERMLAVVVEGLGDDDLPRREHSQRGPGFLIFNARQGLEYLILHIERAAPLVRRGLTSSDMQRRFLCAVIIAAARISEDSFRAIEILTAHLKSNEMQGDAAIAEIALGLMSPAAAMPLREAMDKMDAQCRDAIARVLRTLEAAESAPVTETAEDRSHRLEYAIYLLATKQMNWHHME
jgi:hypothetical protein